MARRDCTLSLWRAVLFGHPMHQAQPIHELGGRRLPVEMSSTWTTTRRRRGTRSFSAAGRTMTAWGFAAVALSFIFTWAGV